MKEKIKNIQDANRFMEKYCDLKYVLDGINEDDLKLVTKFTLFESTAVIGNYREYRDIELSKHHQEKVAKYVKELLEEEFKEIEDKLNKIDIKNQLECEF